MQSITDIVFTDIVGDKATVHEFEIDPIAVATGDIMGYFNAVCFPGVNGIAGRCFIGRLIGYIIPSDQVVRSIAQIDAKKTIPDLIIANYTRSAFFNLDCG